MIKRKTSECVGCGKVRQIYCKNFCPYCYEKQRKKTPLPKPKKQIRKFSKKTLSNLKEYRKVRDEFLKGKKCEFPGCESTEVTLHHGAGRLGAYLTDKRFFHALCIHHHQHVETHPEEARQLGLSYSRLNKEP